MLQLFGGREGVFAQQHAGGAYSPVRPERDITTADMVAHLEGSRTYAVYPVVLSNNPIRGS